MKQSTQQANAGRTARPILVNVRFRFGLRGTVAVVGGGPSGKSNLARLLLRSYDTKQGNIAIDAKNIKEGSTTSLSQAIGVVP